MSSGPSRPSTVDLSGCSTHCCTAAPSERSERHRQIDGYAIDTLLVSTRWLIRAVEVHAALTRGERGHPTGLRPGPASDASTLSLLRIGRQRDRLDPVAGLSQQPDQSRVARQMRRTDHDEGVAFIEVAL